MLLLAPVSPGSTGCLWGDVHEEGRGWVVLAQEGVPASVDVSFSSSSGKVLQPNSQNIPSSLDTVCLLPGPGLSLLSSTGASRRWHLFQVQVLMLVRMGSQRAKQNPMPSAPAAGWGGHCVGNAEIRPYLHPLIPVSWQPSGGRQHPILQIGMWGLEKWWVISSPCSRWTLRLGSCRGRKHKNRPLRPGRLGRQPWPESTVLSRA